MQRGTFRLPADVTFVGSSTVGLTEGVATCDKRHGLFVVHRHAAEGLADVTSGSQRIGVSVGALRIDVDQAHLHGSQWVGEFPLTTVTLVAQPGAFIAPVDFLWLPDVSTPTTEAVGLEAHGL